MGDRITSIRQAILAYAALGPLAIVLGAYVRILDFSWAAERHAIANAPQLAEDLFGPLILTPLGVVRLDEAAAILIFTLASVAWFAAVLRLGGVSRAALAAVPLTFLPVTNFIAPWWLAFRARKAAGAGLVPVAIYAVLGALSAGTWLLHAANVQAEALTVWGAFTLAPAFDALLAAIDPDPGRLWLAGSAFDVLLFGYGVWFLLSTVRAADRS